MTEPTDPNVITLTDTLPTGVSRRRIPWGSQPGQTVYVEPTVPKAEIRESSLMSDEVKAALAANAPQETAEDLAPGVISVADAIAAQTPAPVAAAPAAAPAAIPDQRIDRLEAMIARLVEAQLPKAPEPAPVVPEVTTIDARLFKVNPIAALKAAGIDPALMAPHMPGAKVEPEQRLELTAASLRADMEQTLAAKLAEIEAKEQAFAATQRLATVDTTLSTVDATKYPTLAAIKANHADPNFVKQRVIEAMDVLRAQGNPNPQVADALAGLESIWSVFAAATRAPQTAPQATAPTVPAAVPQATAPATPTTKIPAPRPIARGWGQPTDPARVSALQALLAEAGP